MRAAVFDDAGGLTLLEHELPEPRPGWVRLRRTAVGICGTDLNLARGAFGPTRGIQPGHEIAGVVDLAGDDVDVASGASVVVEPVHGCRRCHFCATGRANLCERVRLLGIALPGGMAEYLLAPASALYTVPADLDPALAALCEPLAVCVRGVRLAAIEPAARVAILGAGSIGLLAIIAARAAGAGEIHVTARYPHQQELARQLGADGVYGSAAELEEAVGGQHLDRVLETVGGSADTLTEAARLTRSGGSILMLGVFEGHTRIPGFEFFSKELTLRSSNCYGRESHVSDFALAIELMGRYGSELLPLVTHRLALDQVADAFAIAADKSSRSIKVQIHA